MPMLMIYIQVTYLNSVVMPDPDPDAEEQSHSSFEDEDEDSAAEEQSS